MSHRVTADITPQSNPVVTDMKPFEAAVLEFSEWQPKVEFHYVDL